MKITCIQMDMQFGAPEENFRKAVGLMEKAMENAPDVLVLPELWNTGFFPRENLPALCDREGERVKKELGALAMPVTRLVAPGPLVEMTTPGRPVTRAKPSAA